MSNKGRSDSESEDNYPNSSPDEQEKGANEKMTEYEKQRAKRMEENRARMEAMGLRAMASSLMGSAQKKKRSDIKGKRKQGDDEEYRPPQENEGSSSSSEDDDLSYRTRLRMSKKNNVTPKRKVPIQKLSSNSDYFEDDDALMQAISLSLQDSAGFLDVVSPMPPQSSDAYEIKTKNTEKKPSKQVQDDAGQRKRKKPFTSRVQMTEDELILHFFQFDEAGKGGITVRDLCRVAAAHDFTWTDEEIKKMIFVFDSDGDGKLSLDDFSKIVDRCNMRQHTGNASSGSRS